jgi:hypothetical protein
MAQIKIPRILGVDLLTDETSLADNKVMYVREAKNVDIDREGNVNRRAGYSQLLAGTGFHSMYVSERGWLLVCQRDELGSFDTLDNTFYLITSMGAAKLTSYAEENGTLYVSNSAYSCMFRPGENTPRTIGVRLPNVLPSFAASTSSGVLPAGQYAICTTLVDEAGEESGTSPVQFIDLSDQGSVVGTLFTVLPGYRWRVYMTTADGEEFYQAAEFDADVASFTVLDHEESRQPRTFGLEPLPYGHIIRAHNSRLLVA